MLPVNGFATASLASGSKLDSAVLPLNALEQRTFFSALQQWNQQGAVEMPPSTQVVINPTTSYQKVVTAGGSTGVSVAPAGTLYGNTTPALTWPEDVQSVNFPFTAPTTGLYQLTINYLAYPSCNAPSVASSSQPASSSASSQYCGRGVSAERGVLIDPPGTVPTVASSASKPPSAPPAVAEAIKSGIPANQLPGFIDPQNSYQAIAPSPAWAIPNTKTPTANPCALDLRGPTGTVMGYDGYQYIEAKQVPFSNVWRMNPADYSVNAKTGYVSYKKDNRGDDLQPLPQQVVGWRNTTVRDSQGIYRDPLLFCLSAGQHVLQLQMVRGPMAISSITFHGVTPLPTYQQQLQKWESAGMKPVTCGLCVQVQGENMYQMSDPTIQPGSTNNPAIVPQTHGYMIFNELNGQYFNQANEWVTYKFTVPQTGLYELSFHELQAGLQGLPSGRDILIDGKNPFSGSQWISIPFKNAWNVITVSQPNGKPALIGLTKGTHTLTMRITLGLVGQAITIINQTNQRLGELLREIEMITGPVPSPVVDYNLPANVPDLLPQMKSIVGVLRQQAALLTYAAGGTPPVAANSIDITAQDLLNMEQHPKTIQEDLTLWQQDEQALATWAQQLQQQPMSIDWFELSSPGARLPAPNPSVWQQIAVTWDSFVLSFYRNYTGVGSRYANGLKVWVGFGTLWATIMSQLADSEFTPATGIHVNFNVVPGGSGIVLLAEVSGHGPDVATGMPATVPLDFALRNGAIDLSKMPGWSQVAKRFVPQATLPYQYTNPQGQTGVYGMPETQDVTMLMYRTDILQALGLPVPSTWPEVYKEIQILQNYGMEFYYGAGPTGLTSFLDQYNTNYYTRNTSTGGIVSNLDAAGAYTAFKQWTQLFTDWQVPIAANFFTRFQTGQMPMGVVSYATFVQVNAAATELQGLWSVAPMPGVPYECSSSNQCTAVTSGPCAYPDFPNQPALPTGMHCFTNYTSGGDSTAVIIPRTAQHPNEAWQFVKWWTSASVQLQFGQDLQAVGGPTVAWNSANQQALAGLPVPAKVIRVFQQVWQQYKPVPVVPGGYISSRYINDVWTNVVISGDNLRSEIRWAVTNINDELYRQEIQYGLVKKVKGRLIVAA